MIQVGVNENIVISKAELNEKKTLTIGVREAGSEVKSGKSSIMEDLSDGSDTGGSANETTFLIFPPNIYDYEDKTVVVEGKKILSQFQDLKNQLTHILRRFLTNDKIKFAPFAGVAINLADDNDILAKIRLQANVDKIYNNYATQFISQITSFLNREDKLGRLFLHRRSETVHFGTLRKKFLADQPFFEDTVIPVNLSKMFTKQTSNTTKFHEPIEVDGIKYVANFSPYELKNKLDDTTRKEEAADNSNSSDDEMTAASSLFTADAGEGEADASATPGIFHVEE
jgi:hypothetical protein